MKITDKYIFFWGGIYSQWYKSKMIINGIEYNCCEQYMMHQKSLLFEPEKNKEISEKIMKSLDPKEQKSLGRQLVGFNKEIWDSKSLSIVFKGNLSKFSQNKILLNEMMSTGNRIFVEASPNDKIWGIGLHYDDEGIDNPENWMGTNLLGQVLTIVRNELS